MRTRFWFTAIFFLFTFTRCAHLNQRAEIPDPQRALWTMSDMKSWRIVMGAYKEDHGSYPKAKTIEELIPLVQPIYIRYAPRVDAWGNPYIFELDDVAGYRIVSRGSDGKIDRATWTTPGKQDSYATDAVATAEGDSLMRSWSLK